MIHEKGGQVNVITGLVCPDRTLPVKISGLSMAIISEKYAYEK
jgi:hypothetical protein